METICQSCRMPMDREELFGTNADGSKNADYCMHCLKTVHLPQTWIWME